MISDSKRQSDRTCASNNPLTISVCGNRIIDLCWLSITVKYRLILWRRTDLYNDDCLQNFFQRSDAFFRKRRSFWFYRLLPSLVYFCSIIAVSSPKRSLHIAGWWISSTNLSSAEEQYPTPIPRMTPGCPQPHTNRIKEIAGFFLERWTGFAVMITTQDQKWNFMFSK